ncbi:lantibiotic biosynthesis dehydratase-like protein [Actinokineospora auranticolor]|uniref:Lantibiotic biosynthesis dehydratase-like protein n=1 Tax=Actinokineospora auranticolor TaxID=155976 RepID=A0A2S6GF37_9PSEU|nr:lantibiotic biosynthesis dehydratase-like protein [Actinokineospora auranticolor]
MAAEPTARLGEHFVVRVAGLPLAALRDLRCPTSRRWVDAVLRAEEDLTAEGRELSDAVHDVVHAADDGTRRALLRLRRDLFNNRVPVGDPGAVVGSLDPALGDRVAHWTRRRRALVDLLAAGTRPVAADLARSRTALRALATEPRLRAGMLLASPTLDGQLDGYLADRPGKPDKRTRRIERSLLSYLYRSAAKTSPFSTFTGVALGRFDTGPRTGRSLPAGEDWVGHVRLNVVVLARLTDLLLADPDRRGDLPVAPTPDFARDPDRVRYVRRWVTTGDADAAVTFDAVSDKLFYLRRSGALDRLLGVFAQATGPHRYRDLVAWLAEDLGVPADECDRYLDALVRLGLLRVPVLDTDAHTADPLARFRDALVAVDRPWARELADALGGPAEHLRRFPGAGVELRRELLAALRRDLRAVLDGLGGERVGLPRTVVYEDVRAGAPATARADWAELVEEPLRQLRRLLPAFDLVVAQRLTLLGYFVARHGRGGRCADVLGLVHEFHEDFYNQYTRFAAARQAFDADGEYVPETNWLGLPALVALDSARRVFTARIRALADAAGPGAVEVELDGDLVDAVAAALPPTGVDFQPYSHFLQVAERGPGTVAVVNQSYGGLFFPFSRFTHCFPDDDLAGTLLRTARRLQPPGAVFAEVTGGQVTTNLNLHGRLTPYQIVVPGEVSTVDAEHRIPLADLVVAHDAEADRLVLRSNRLGREVIPVYLGYLVPLALPEIARTLLLLSPASLARLDPWGGVPATAVDGVARRPRLRLGPLVLARRAWETTAGALPLRAPGAGDPEWLLAWHRWRRAHGVPERVFATVTGASARGPVTSKPQYVDFDSQLSLLALEALITDPGDRVVLTEALPDADETHVVSARGGHVAEIAVETHPIHREEGDR